MVKETYERTLMVSPSRRRNFDYQTSRHEVYEPELVREERELRRNRAHLNWLVSDDLYPPGSVEARANQQHISEMVAPNYLANKNKMR